MATGTVKEYLIVMVGKGIITAESNLTNGLHYSNSKNYFTLPDEVFLLKLPPTAFMVYAYLLLIEDRRTHICHPSCNTISNITGMTKDTALKSISMLEETELITVEPSNYLDKRGMK